MSLERFPPDNPREWLNRARSNLIQARGETEGVYLEDLCFQTQQAVEKSLKALLMHRGIRFPYIHDISELIRILEDSSEQVPERIRESAMLSDFAVEARYPGLAEPVTREEYEEALQIAEEVIAWAEERISQ